MTKLVNIADPSSLWGELSVHPLVIQGCVCIVLEESFIVCLQFPTICPIPRISTQRQAIPPPKLSIVRPSPPPVMVYFILACSSKDGGFAQLHMGNLELAARMVQCLRYTIYPLLHPYHKHKAMSCTTPPIWTTGHTKHTGPCNCSTTTLRLQHRHIAPTI